MLRVENRIIDIDSNINGQAVAPSEISTYYTYNGISINGRHFSDATRSPDSFFTLEAGASKEANVDVNAWYTFHKPGTYRMRINSRLMMASPLTLTEEQVTEEPTDLVLLEMNERANTTTHSSVNAYTTGPEFDIVPFQHPADTATASMAYVALTITESDTTPDLTVCPGQLAVFLEETSSSSSLVHAHTHTGKKGSGDGSTAPTQKEPAAGGFFSHARNAFSNGVSTLKQMVDRKATAVTGEGTKTQTLPTIFAFKPKKVQFKDDHPNGLGKCSISQRREVIAANEFAKVLTLSALKYLTYMDKVIGSHPMQVDAEGAYLRWLEDYASEGTVKAVRSTSESPSELWDKDISVKKMGEPPCMQKLADKKRKQKYVKSNTSVLSDVKSAMGLRKEKPSLFMETSLHIGERTHTHMSTISTVEANSDAKMKSVIEKSSTNKTKSAHSKRAKAEKAKAKTTAGGGPNIFVKEQDTSISMSEEIRKNMAANRAGKQAAPPASNVFESLKNRVEMSMEEKGKKTTKSTGSGDGGVMNTVSHMLGLGDKFPYALPDRNTLREAITTFRSIYRALQANNHQYMCICESDLSAASTTMTAYLEKDGSIIHVCDRFFTESVKPPVKRNVEDTYTDIEGTWGASPHSLTGNGGSRNSVSKKTGHPAYFSWRSMQDVFDYKSYKNLRDTQSGTILNEISHLECVLGARDVYNTPLSAYTFNKKISLANRKKGEERVSVHGSTLNNAKSLECFAEDVYLSREGHRFESRGYFMDRMFAHRKSLTMYTTKKFIHAQAQELFGSEDRPKTIEKKKVMNRQIADAFGLRAYDAAKVFAIIDGTGSK